MNAMDGMDGMDMSGKQKLSSMVDDGSKKRQATSQATLLKFRVLYYCELRGGECETVKARLMMRCMPIKKTIVIFN